MEERIFELEEALAAAKETNERMECQLNEKKALSSPPPPSIETSNSSDEGARLAVAEARIAELVAALVKLQEEQLTVCHLFLFVLFCPIRKPFMPIYVSALSPRVTSLYCTALRHKQFLCSQFRLTVVIQCSFVSNN